MITSRMEMSLAACGCSMPGTNRVCRLACPRSGFAKIRLPARSCRARKSGRTMRRGAPTGTCPSPRCAVAAGSHTRVQLASISPCYAWRRGVTARAGRRWGREWVCHRVVVGPAWGERRQRRGVPSRRIGYQRDRGWSAGRGRVALTPTGEAQAAALNTWFARLPAGVAPQAVWSSPYLRAVQTAEIAVRGGVVPFGTGRCLLGRQRKEQPG